MIRTEEKARHFILRQIAYGLAAVAVIAVIGFTEGSISDLAKLLFG